MSQRLLRSNCCRGRRSVEALAATMADDDNDDADDDFMPIEPHGRPCSSTVVVSAAKHAGNGDGTSKKAVLAMLKVAADDWSKLAFFANDAMHVVVHMLLAEESVFELPNIEDAKDWYVIIQIVYSIGQQQKKKFAAKNKKKRSREESEDTDETEEKPRQKLDEAQLATITDKQRREMNTPVWEKIIKKHFKHHDLLLQSCFHTNQFEAMAQKEATNCGEFNKNKIVRAHVKYYLVAKYQLQKGGAMEMAGHVLSESPVDFQKIRNEAMAKTHSVEDAQAIVQTEADMYRSFVGFKGTDPRAIAAYRFFMLQAIDFEARRFFLLQAIDQKVKEVQAANKTKGKKQKEHPPKRFSIIPMHSCGGTLTADITGNWMSFLLSAVKHKHQVFFKHVSEARNGATTEVIAAANAHETFHLNPEAEEWHPDGGIYYTTKHESRLPRDITKKLWFYFDGLETIKNRKSTTKWRVGGTIRTDGVDLHVIFDKNRKYMKDGRPLPDKYVPRSERVNDKTWDVPAYPKQMPEDRDKWTDLAGVDVGYHNLFYATRYTGSHTDGGDPEVEVRKVKKTWFDRASGRTAKLHKAKRLTTTAQKKKYLEGITENSLKTADSEAFIRGIHARRDAWQPLYQIYSNKKAKRLKLAMRARENQAIDRIIKYITWNGKVIPAIGDCGRTTGFRGLSPGGPVKKIKRRLIKRGYSACEVPEQWSSKSSVCCHGAVNEEQKNNQPPQKYKVKKGENPSEKPVPSKVHGILICPKCGRTWDRDFVGALNITDIAIDHLLGLPRHWRFTKALKKFTGEVEPHGIIPRQSMRQPVTTVAACRPCKTLPRSRKSRKY